MKNNDQLVDNTKLEKYNSNFVVLKDYAENIDKIFDKEEITDTLVFFPDPWARKKSWLKRRLVKKDFLDKLYKITKS
jgi:tRNA G46 methylase TrmB